MIFVYLFLIGIQIVRYPGDMLVLNRLVAIFVQEPLVYEFLGRLLEYLCRLFSLQVLLFEFDAGHHALVARVLDVAL